MAAFKTGFRLAPVLLPFPKSNIFDYLSCYTAAAAGFLEMTMSKSDAHGGTAHLTLTDTSPYSGLSSLMAVNLNPQSADGHDVPLSINWQVTGQDLPVTHPASSFILQIQIIHHMPSDENSATDTTVSQKRPAALQLGPRKKPYVVDDFPSFVGI
jgi:hypothetical protein